MPTKERGIANAKRGSRETNKPNPVKVSLSANTSGDRGSGRHTLSRPLTQTPSSLQQRSQTAVVILIWIRIIGSVKKV